MCISTTKPPKHQEPSLFLFHFVIVISISISAVMSRQVGANSAGVDYSEIPRGVRRTSQSSESSEGSEYYMEVYLKKHRPDVDFRLSPAEIAQLVFRDLAIPEDSVTGIGQGDLRYLEIGLNVNPQPWLDLGAIWIRDGLTTGGAMQARANVVWVTLQGASLKTKNREIKRIFSAFGKFTSAIQKVKPSPRTNPPASLAGKWNGNKKWSMLVESNIPNFAFVEGRRCRVFYNGQEDLCKYCGKSIMSCPGDLIFDRCRELGGVRADLRKVWDDTWEAASARSSNRDMSYDEAMRRAAEMREGRRPAPAGSTEAPEEASEDAQAAGGGRPTSAIPGLAAPPKKKKAKPAVSELVAMSEQIELHKVILDVTNEEMWSLILEALQVDRVNAGKEWRLFKIKDRCWIMYGLTEVEREVLYSVNLKLRNKFLVYTRPHVEPFNQTVIGGQSGLPPPVVPMPSSDSVPNGPTAPPPPTPSNTNFPPLPPLHYPVIHPRGTAAPPPTPQQPEASAQVSQMDISTLPLPEDARPPVRVVLPKDQWDANLAQFHTPLASTLRDPTAIPIASYLSPEEAEAVEDAAALSALGVLEEIAAAQAASHDGFRQVVTSKRNRHNSGNVSSISSARPTPKRQNMNNTGISADSTIYEEAIRLGGSQFYDPVDIEGVEVDLDGTDMEVDTVLEGELGDSLANAQLETSEMLDLTLPTNQRAEEQSPTVSDDATSVDTNQRVEEQSQTVSDDTNSVDVPEAGEPDGAAGGVTEERPAVGSNAESVNVTFTAEQIHGKSDSPQTNVSVFTSSGDKKRKKKKGNKKSNVSRRLSDEYGS